MSLKNIKLLQEPIMVLHFGQSSSLNKFLASVSSIISGDWCNKIKKVLYVVLYPKLPMFWTIAHNCYISEQQS